ncbi:MAG: leucine-rich repeat protein, partial [Clostridia bacterium]|nr:leucine-rich repeat protein [Clostridia bacterium]
TDFTIPNSVVCIDSYAFYSSKNLIYIRISKFVTHIGNYAFAYCSSVKNIYFEDNSTWYYTEDLDGWKELTGGKTINVSGSSTIAVFLTDTMYSYYYTYFYKTE